MWGDSHIDIPYPKSISHIPYRYSYRYLMDVRSSISLFHIDLPYRYRIMSCHIASMVKLCLFTKTKTWCDTTLWYDKVPEAINFRALAHNNQFKIIESTDAI